MQDELKSDYYKEQAAQEENDLKVLGLLNKAIREKRIENFDDNWKNKIIEHNRVKAFEDIPSQHKLTFHINNIGNCIDFYPKANKVLIRKKNKWIKPGLNYLIKLLNIEND